MKWGLTAEELAARAGLTRATVVKMESGYGNPTIETIAALSRAFTLSARELIRMAEVPRVETGKQTVFQDDVFTGEHIVKQNDPTSGLQDHPPTSICHADFLCVPASFLDQT